MFANGMSFPKLAKKSQPTVLVDGEREGVFSVLGKTRSCWPVPKVFGMGWVREVRVRRDPTSPVLGAG